MNSREWIKIKPYVTHKGKVTKQWRTARVTGADATTVVTLDRHWSLVMPKQGRLRFRTWSSKGARHKVSALMATLVE